MWSCECLSGVAWAQERTKPWPRYHVFVSAERERTECFYVKKKKKGMFPMVLVCSSATLF